MDECPVVGSYGTPNEQNGGDLTKHAFFRLESAPPFRPVIVIHKHPNDIISVYSRF